MKSACPPLSGVSGSSIPGTDTPIHERFYPFFHIKLGLAFQSTAGNGQMLEKMLNPKGGGGVSGGNKQTEQSAQKQLDSQKWSRILAMEQSV